MFVIGAGEESEPLFQAGEDQPASGNAIAGGHGYFAS